jgi:hypothetical protein
MEIRFADRPPTSEFDRGAISFIAFADEQPVKCVATFEFLGIVPSTDDAAAALQAVDEQWEAIQALASDLIEKGEVKDDELILIREKGAG